MAARVRFQLYVKAGKDGKCLGDWPHTHKHKENAGNHHFFPFSQLYYFVIHTSAFNLDKVTKILSSLEGFNPFPNDKF